VSPPSAFNEAEDAIDVGGLFFGTTKKWRDVQHNPRVTLLVDDVLSNPRRPGPWRSGARPSSTKPAATRSTPASPTSPPSSSGSGPGAS
jgi:hypothetical protein